MRSGHGWRRNRHKQSIRDRRPCHRQERHIDVPHPHPGVRGKTGVVVEFRPDWVIPEDEAWGRDTPERGGREEPFYVVRFKQKDLWPNYTGFDVDTLETEVAQRWLKPAKGDAK